VNKIKIIPNKLNKGDFVRIIAPSRSFTILSDETKDYANKRFIEMGLKLTFGKHIKESDNFNSSSIQSRLWDLHDAFSDKKIKAIITVIGGFNSNQLLSGIDWKLIKDNPKILCGFSDITALNNSIYAKTGLITYSGPHYSTFGQKLYLDYTIDYFQKCLMSNNPFDISPSEKWSDDEWYIDQNKRNLMSNDGFLIINKGKAEGTILGANLCTLNLLQGTDFMPSLDNSVLFLEGDCKSSPYTFDSELQSLIHQPGFDDVKGIIIGRFQKESKMSSNLLKQIVQTKKELNNIPVIANVDFGHTDPKITFPIGGTCILNAISSNSISIKITKH